MNITITHNGYPWWVEVEAKKSLFVNKASMAREQTILDWLDQTFGHGGWSAPEPDIFGSSPWRFQFATEEQAEQFKRFVSQLLADEAQ